MIIGICDDDIIFVQSMASKVRQMLSRLYDGDTLLVRSFGSASAVEEYIRSNHIHILFLDIDMPKKNGFELAAELNRVSPDTLIIFTSAYDNLVYHSFEFRPFHFLRKHHIQSELEPVLKRAIDELTQSREQALLHTIDGDVSASIRDITYIESSKNYCLVHCGRDVTYTMRNTLSSLETDFLPHGFCRIHTAFLVNLYHVQSVGNNRLITLSDGTELNVSVRKWDEFQEAYFAYGRRHLIR